MKYARRSPLTAVDTFFAQQRTRLGAKGSIVGLLLVPALFGVVHFGFQALLVLVTSVVSCIIAAHFVRVLNNQPCDFIPPPGPIITGLLIGITLTAQTPLYMIVVGGFTAEFLGKAVFPRLGRNLFNPAVLGRSAIAVLETLYPVSYGPQQGDPDMVSSASVLFKEAGGQTVPSYLDAFLGITSGAIGETSILVLGLVGIFLFRYVIIKREAAVAMIAATPLMVMLLPPTAEIVGHAPWVTNPLMYILGSSTVLTAVFFATDPTTTPHSRLGCILFGIGVATIGVAGKFYTTTPGFEMYGILVMNLLTPLLNHIAGAVITTSPRKSSNDASTTTKDFWTDTFYAVGPHPPSEKLLPSPFTTQTPTFDNYAAKGPFRMLQKYQLGATRETVLEKLQESNLRGCGGGHFPAAQKWQAALAHPGPRCLVVNGLEGEPSTFKDLFLMREHSRLLVEGLAIAAWVLETSQVKVVINTTYSECSQIVSEALKELEIHNAGELPFQVEVITGPEADLYVCGEESALIEYLEGRPCEPQLRPPFPTEKGVEGKPTVIHNVETLCWVPLLLEQSAHFATHGIPKLVSLSGPLKRPGVYEVSMGTPLVKIMEMAGGLRLGYKLKALSVGGVSGGFLSHDALELPFTVEKIREAGAMVGTGTIRFYSIGEDLIEEILATMTFFQQETCGRCTPCRVGCGELLRYTQRLARKEITDADHQWLMEVTRTMQLTSTCGFGVAVPQPLLSFLAINDE